VKFLRLSDKRADDNFRAGKTWGHEVIVPAQNVANDRVGNMWGEKTEQHYNRFTGLKPDARKFLQANGAFTWEVRKTNQDSIAIFRLAREDAAMMFKLKFA
jgi:hypothetical protein